MTSSARRYANKGNLTEGSLTRHITRLTLPMIWGLLAVISVQVIDTWYLSLLGTDELAAITFTFPVTYGVHSLMIGMSIATSSVISRQIGQKNWPRVRRLTTHALILAVILGLIFAIGGILLMTPVFSLMGAEGNIMVLVREYMLIWFAGNILVNAPMIGNAAIRATGDTFIPAIIMTIVAVVNVILDPLLIFGLFGFPRLEMTGAAVSTVFANGCALMVALYIIDKKKDMMARSRRHLRLFFDSVKRFLFIAVPAGLTTAIQPLTNAVIVALLAGVSAEAVAGYGIVSRIEAFSFVTIMALAVGMAPIIGQNWGAAKYQRVHETLQKVFLFAFLWSLGVALLLGLLAKPIAGLFSEDASVISTAALYFWIVTTSAAFGNLVQGWASAFNAMGKPQRAFLMIFVKLVLLTMPLAYIGSLFAGVPGIFGGIALANASTGIGFHLWNRRYVIRHEKQAQTQNFEQ